MTCLLVNLYYYSNKQQKEMKILPSSPYAIFNVKEWESLVNSRKKFNQKNKCNLQKYYYKNFKECNAKNSVKNEIKKTKLIQLSFV